MQSKNELKKIDAKNRLSYYFDDKIHGIVINFRDILLDEKLYEDNLVYGISYKTSTSPKPLHIRFDKLDGFLRVRGNEFRHLLLFDYGLFDENGGKIKYLISEESGITDSINHNFGVIRIDSYIFLPIEKILSVSNVIILIKSVINKNKRRYY